MLGNAYSVYYSIANNNWQAMQKMYFNDGGVWKLVDSAWFNDAGVWKLFIKPPVVTPPVDRTIIVSVNPIYLSGFGSTGNVWTDEQAVVSARYADNSPSTFSYQWFRESGSTLITPTNAQSSATYFKKSSNTAGNSTSYFYCRVTDGLTTVNTVAVEINIKHTGGGEIP